MTRRRAFRVMQGHATLLPRMRQRNAEPPFWSGRRIRAYLCSVEQRPVNKKRELRLRREHHPLVQPNLRPKTKQTPVQSNPRPTTPNEWRGIDVTKVPGEGCGWGSIVVVLDWYTKAIVGYRADWQRTTPPWLAALDIARNRQFPEGAQGEGMPLMSDNGCQPTSVAFMRARSTLGIHQACTSDHNPKGNADAERMMRPLTEECFWRQEWTAAFTLASALKTWIDQGIERYILGPGLQDAQAV
jgi:putative transposase